MAEAPAQTQANSLEAFHNLIDFMTASGVKYADYLEFRGWFRRSAVLQSKVLQVILKGKASEINVVHGDFDDHITQLMND